MTQGVAEYANVIIPEAELEPEPETAGAEQQPAEDPGRNRKQRNQSRIWSRKLTETKILRVKKQKNQSTATK